VVVLFHNRMDLKRVASNNYRPPVYQFERINPENGKPDLNGA